MPAAAVIPAPIAYINVVAVKKLVVGFLPILPVPDDIHRSVMELKWVSYHEVAASCRR